jgi:hypothetical protein
LYSNTRTFTVFGVGKLASCAFFLKSNVPLFTIAHTKRGRATAKPMTRPKDKRFFVF